MKVKITFKDPDNSFTDLYSYQQEAIWMLWDKYTLYDEYVSLEFDTELGTCRVVENS